MQGFVETLCKSAFQLTICINIDKLLSMTNYIEREAEKELIKLAGTFPVVAINGPRQSGKTTLARHVFAEKPYVNLESPENRALLAEDAKSFLGRFPDGAIIDEAQYVPEIFSWLQTIVDESGKMGQFVITGSQNLSITDKISQSLAGRVATVTLLPFSQKELSRRDGYAPTLEEALFTGGYPPVFFSGRDTMIWLDNYIQTYLERDVRQIANIRNLSVFQTFLALCAGRNAQILNASALAADCGISTNTAREWLSVLQASYILFTLRPYHNNFNKRLIKSPKLYFYDTGLVCRLLGVQAAEQLFTHPLRGAIFESYVVSEAAKRYYNAVKTPPLWYWRDSNGLEVDLLIDKGHTIFPVEIKSGRTYSSDFLNGISKWNLLSKNESGAVVYGGDTDFTVKDYSVASWRNVADIVR